MSKICVYCEHWYVRYEHDWSDVTPGEGFSTGCCKGLWWTNGYDMSQKDFRQKLEVGLTCEQFKKAEQ